MWNWKSKEQTNNLLFSAFLDQDLQEDERTDITLNIKFHVH